MPRRMAIMTNPEEARNSSPPVARRLVNLLLGGGVLASLASFLYPALRYIIPPPVPESTSRSVIAAKVNELKLNSAKIFQFGSKPALLIRTANDEYKAISAVCTHLSCTVQYREDLHQVWCACHNGLYDVEGRNVSGPPPRPLEVFDVHVQGGDIIAARKA